MSSAWFEASSQPSPEEELSPIRASNGPGLNKIDYRISRHSEFLARILWHLPRVEVQDPFSDTEEILHPLATLRARSLDDPTVALADAWASVLDVMTFYQERIAQEAFIHTATERRSLVELARTVGYELDPGVAASAFLAFSVDDADDPFRLVDVPEGTQVMSVPRETGQLPQIFETIEPIRARAEWNAIPVRRERPQRLVLYNNRDNSSDSNNGKLFLLDIDDSIDEETLEDGNLWSIDSSNSKWAYPVNDDLDVDTIVQDHEKAGFEWSLKGIEVREIVLRRGALGLSEGDRVLIVGVRTDETSGPDAYVRPFRITKLTEFSDGSFTRVAIEPILKETATSWVPPRLAFRTVRLRIGKVTGTPLSFDRHSVDREILKTSWSGPSLEAFLRAQAWSRDKLMRLVREQKTSAGAGESGVFVLRERVGFFGNTAPKQESLAITDNLRGQDGYGDSWDTSPRPIWQDSQGNPLGQGIAFLERDVEDVVPNSWILIESPLGDTLTLRVSRSWVESRTDFATTAKSTGLSLVNPDGTSFTKAAENKVFTFRTAQAYVSSEAVELSGLPIDEAIEAKSDIFDLDSLYLNLEPGRAISIEGERQDAPGVTESEAIPIKSISHLGGFTRLTLQAGARFTYQRRTVTINANVALSTHGEKAEEVLGSGDATLAHQVFTLATTPLTYVASDTETGASSTLEVRVEGVLWEEVDSLLHAAAQDEVYMVRTDDEGTTRVVFGDGVNGKRLPSGVENVRASYRVGLGTEGEVAAQSLIQLRTRPLGIRSVVNPAAARGGAPASSLEDAQRAVPQSVLTLGRLVSLRDYGDFARSFAGIGKAKANLVWEPQGVVVYLTVCPVQDGVFEMSDPTLSTLEKALHRMRDPSVPVKILPHRPRFFRVKAKIFYDRRHEEDSVQGRVRTALEGRLTYEARDLGESLSSAEVLSIVQQVEGVVYVDLERFELFSAATESEVGDVASVIGAGLATWSSKDKKGEGAELLTMLASAVELTLEARDETR